MGKPQWTVTTIRSILSNEKYKGDALLQKTYVVDCISHKSKKNDDRPQYYVENNHPAIISREMFDRVQEELARRNNKRKVKQVGTKTESGKYSSKYALTELLVCGHCGTPYRRCTWTSHGTKRIVWRCISRLDYGKKYCADSPTIEESILQNTIVHAIRELADQSSLGNAASLLKAHVGIYFGGDHSVAADELRAKELVGKITDAASSGSYTSEMAELVEELNAVKQRITEKKKTSQDSAASVQRLSEVTKAIDGLKGCSIPFDNHIVRKLIDCICVLSADEIEITFKGMPPQRYSLRNESTSASSVRGCASK